MSASPLPEVTDDDLALVLYLATYNAQRGYPPTYREIAQARGIAHSTVRDRVARLVAAGVLRHDHGIRRGLALAPVGYLPAVTK